MSDDPQRPTPPDQASPPREVQSGSGTIRNTDPSAGGRLEASGDEPGQEDLGRRSFAGENVAADQRRQAAERGAGLGAGGSDNRDARHPARDEIDTRGLERDGNGDPLGGMVPEDDLD